MGAHVFSFILLPYERISEGKFNKEEMELLLKWQAEKQYCFTPQLRECGGVKEEKSIVFILLRGKVR